MFKIFCMEIFKEQENVYEIKVLCKLKRSLQNVRELFGKSSFMVRKNTGFGFG